MVVQYLEPLDRTFHALGDVTRRGMLALLAERSECTAGELGEPFDIAQPTASRHIRVLEAAGLVLRSVNGRVHRFRLEDEAIQEASLWIARQRDFWQASLDALEDCLNKLAPKGGGNQ